MSVVSVEVVSVEVEVTSLLLLFFLLSRHQFSLCPNNMSNKVAPNDSAMMSPKQECNPTDFCMIHQFEVKTTCLFYR
jgi:hypothetical protein